MGIRSVVKKAAKKAGRETVGKAVKAARKGARRMSEATPGYGSYAKTMKELTRDGKSKRIK